MPYSSNSTVTQVLAYTCTLSPRISVLEGVSTAATACYPEPYISYGRYDNDNDVYFTLTTICLSVRLSVRHTLERSQKDAS